MASSYQQFRPVAGRLYRTSWQGHAVSQNCREDCINFICIVISVLPLRWPGSCCCMLHSHASLLALGAAKPTGDPNHATHCTGKHGPTLDFHLPVLWNIIGHNYVEIWLQVPPPFSPRPAWKRSSLSNSATNRISLYCFVTNITK